MARKARSATPRRLPLTRERILRAALGLLDEGGPEVLSMRNLGAALGVPAMSIYGHVASKEELLDGIVDLVAQEIHAPTSGTDWRIGMRQRAESAREVLLRHPWAARLLESQSRLGLTRLRALDAVFGALRAGGFTVVGAYRALMLMDSYVYGFTLQETSWRQDESPADAADGVRQQFEAGAFPHLGEVLAHFTADPAPGNRADTMACEFEAGLELVLEAMATLLRRG